MKIGMEIDLELDESGVKFSWEMCGNRGDRENNNGG